MSSNEANIRSNSNIDIQRACTNEWCHTDHDARIYINQFKVVEVNNEKHPVRIWNTMHWNHRIEGLQNSEILQQCIEEFPKIST